MATRRKFNLKKFNQDREDSYERSKKGELKLIAPKKLDTLIGVTLERIRKQGHPLYERAEACPHKYACGCKIPLRKRTKPECVACL